MRQSFIEGSMGRHRILARFNWDDRGTPTLVLTRGRQDAAISLNDAWQFKDTDSAKQHAGRIASALGLDYWSSIDRAAVLDSIYRNLDKLVSMPPAPRDGLERERMLRQDGITHLQVRQGGRTVMETGI